MGLNREALGLLALARASGADFSRVLMAGRQKLTVDSAQLAQFFSQRGRSDLAAKAADMRGDGYSEGLLKTAFGAGSILSMDYSDYEGAGLIHDLNTPMAPAETYSLVTDFGTLEHVFNLPVAFDNLAKLTAPNGHILHVLPSNNFVGHGFYQFSPELFFQIYSPERGYSDTRVFASTGSLSDVWFEIRAPRDLKARVNITSRGQLYLMVVTRKTGEPVPLVQKPVQQSDYVEIWNASTEAPTKRAAPGALDLRLKQMLSGIRHHRKVARKDLTRDRGDIIRRKLLDLVPAFQ
jgi:hypothetical protein